MKQQHPDLDQIESIINKDFDQITSYDIINQAIEHKNPLCLKVVDKFAEIFGREVGNLALKTLPYGGIYLIGGVTNGIKDYLVSHNTFMEAFYDKGRVSDFMRKFRINVVHSHIEVGLLGAQEKARRELLK